MDCRQNVVRNDIGTGVTIDVYVKFTQNNFKATLRPAEEPSP